MVFGILSILTIRDNTASHLLILFPLGLIDVAVVHHVQLLTVFLAAGAGQGGEEEGSLVTGLVTGLALKMRALEGSQHCG